MIADVLEAGLAETAEKVRALGRVATAVATDVSQKTSVDALAAQAVATHGRIDVWANVAGVLRYSTILDTTEDVYALVTGVNQAGVVWGTARRRCANAGASP